MGFIQITALEGIKPIHKWFNTWLALRLGLEGLNSAEFHGVLLHTRHSQAPASPRIFITQYLISYIVLTFHPNIFALHTIQILVLT